MCDPNLQCSAEEADTRLWLHAIKSEGHKKLVFSPDTDTLFTGLGMVNVVTIIILCRFGKVAFFKAYSKLVSDESGALSHILNEGSYLAFLRMIGVIYFQRHRYMFSYYHSPMAHFHSHKSDKASIKQQHLNWIDSFKTQHVGSSNI